MAHDRYPWWRPHGRNPFGLDPNKPLWPQVVALVAELSYIFGGLIIGLAGIQLYPALVPDETIYATGLGSIVIFFLLSFALFNTSFFPASMTTFAKLQFRAGWALCTAFLVLGLAMIANGYAMPLTERVAPVVAKRATLEHDPNNRTYYLAIRPWLSSPRVTELPAPQSVFASLDVPTSRTQIPAAKLEAMPNTARVWLVLGEGRFGVEWVKDIRAVSSAS